MIDRAGGVVAKPIQEEINYERETSIPTAGVIVKSCLDDCNICEDEVQRREKLELERLELQNKLLARQIELLEKSQEYRCCPLSEGSADCLTRQVSDTWSNKSDRQLPVTFIDSNSIPQLA